MVNILSNREWRGHPGLASQVADNDERARLTRKAVFAYRRERIRISSLDIGWKQTEGDDAMQRRFNAAGDDWSSATGSACRWISWRRSTRSPTASLTSSAPFGAE